MANQKRMTNNDLFKGFTKLSVLAQVMVIQGMTAQYENVLENQEELLREGTGTPFVHPQAWINAAKEVKELYTEYEASNK